MLHGGTGSQFILEAAHEWTCSFSAFCFVSAAHLNLVGGKMFPVFPRTCGMWKIWLYDINIDLTVNPPLFLERLMIAFSFGILLFPLLASNLPSVTFSIVWPSTRFVVNNVPVGIFLPLSNIFPYHFNTFLASAMGYWIYKYKEYSTQFLLL